MLKFNRFLTFLITTVVVAWAAYANADVIVLNFAGLDGNTEEEPLNYYDGGFGSDGSGPGTNYGITFESNAITCTGQPGGICNSAEIPGGPGALLLYFLNGTADTMEVPGGFTTGFSFDYSAAVDPGNVTVWSGLNGTGTLLATLNLARTPNDGDIGCDGTSFCPYEPFGVTFSGTAESVDFAGTDNEIAFADITVGSAIAGGGGDTVPEPTSIALFGLGLAGVGYMRRRKAN